MLGDALTPGEILAAVQVGLAGTFIVAATGKALRSDEVRRVLRISRLPETAVPLVARLVPALEVIIAASLLLATGDFLATAFVGALASLAIFSAWMLSIIMRGVSASCACFGGASANISWKSVLRNALFAGFAAGGAALAHNHGSALPDPSPPEFAVVIAGLLVAALATAVYSISSELVLRFSQIMDVPTEKEGSA